MAQQMYKAEFRVRGSVEHAFPIWDVTEKEILYLRGLHNRPDVVVKIKKTGTVERDDNEEYKRLADKYSQERIEGFFNIKIMEAIIEDGADEDDEDEIVNLPDPPQQTGRKMIKPIPDLS